MREGIVLVRLTPLPFFLASLAGGQGGGVSKYLLPDQPRVYRTRETQMI
jgi:hypothetical protein